MYEELKKKIMKWTPFFNRDKTLMCRKQVLCLIEEVENLSTLPDGNSDKSEETNKNLEVSASPTPKESQKAYNDLQELKNGLY